MCIKDTVIYCHWSEFWVPWLVLLSLHKPSSAKSPPTDTPVFGTSPDFWTLSASVRAWCHCSFCNNQTESRAVGRHTEGFVAWTAQADKYLHVVVFTAPCIRGLRLPSLYSAAPHLAPVQSSHCPGAGLCSSHGETTHRQVQQPSDIPTWHCSLSRISQWSSKTCS